MMKRNSVLFVFIGLIVFFLFIFSPIVRSKAKTVILGIARPFASGFHTLGIGIKNQAAFILSIGELADKNKELASKIVELEVDKSQISELEAENNLLKKELGFLGENEKGTLIPAKIIERDPFLALDYVVVDKGSADGIKVNMTVISSGVMVGQVKEVYEKSAKIVLVTSKDSLVQAMIQSNRSKGILRGGLSGLYLDNIDSDTDYAPGDYVVTSGLGGEIKEGILVGKAGKTKSASSGIFKSVAVDPIIEYSKLELVFIQK